MTKSLSLNLRERVVTAVDGRMSWSQAAKRFDVGVANAIRWCQRARETGSSKVTPQGGDRSSERIKAERDLTRLVLHTGAYWLILALRDAIPATFELMKAEFDTLRIETLKIGARIIKTASRIRVHLVSACPNAWLFLFIAGWLAAAGP